MNKSEYLLKEKINKCLDLDSENMKDYKSKFERASTLRKDIADNCTVANDSIIEYSQEYKERAHKLNNEKGVLSDNISEEKTKIIELISQINSQK